MAPSSASKANRADTSRIELVATTSKSEATTKINKFADLSLELRDEIANHHGLPELLSLVRTDKAFHRDSIPRLYKNATLALQFGYRDRDCSVPNYHAALPNIQNASFSLNLSRHMGPHHTHWPVKIDLRPILDFGTSSFPAREMCQVTLDYREEGFVYNTSRWVVQAMYLLISFKVMRVRILCGKWERDSTEAPRRDYDMVRRVLEPIHGPGVYGENDRYLEFHPSGCQSEEEFDGMYEHLMLAVWKRMLE